MDEYESDAQKQYEALPGMTIYYLRLLKRGPLWTPDETAEVTRLQAAHIAYGNKLREEGKSIINGPLLDNGDLRGVSILHAASLADALALSDADPAVQAGRLVSEVHPWMVDSGILPE